MNPLHISQAFVGLSQTPDGKKSIIKNNTLDKIRHFLINPDTNLEPKEQKEVALNCLNGVSAFVSKINEAESHISTPRQNHVREKNLLTPLVELTFSGDDDIKNAATLAVNKCLAENQENGIIIISTLQALFWLSILKQDETHTFLDHQLRQRVVSVNLSFNPENNTSFPTTLREQSPATIEAESKLEPDMLQATYEASSPTHTEDSTSLAEAVREKTGDSIKTALSQLAALMGNQADQEALIANAKDYANEEITMVYQAIFERADDTLSLLIKHDILKVLGAHVQSKDSEIIQKTLLMLSAIAEKIKNSNQQLIHDTRIIELLIAGFNECKEVNEVTTAYLNTLIQISNKDPKAIQTLVDSEITPLLEQSLSIESIALEALLLLSIIKEPTDQSTDLKLTSLAALPRIKTMLESQDDIPCIHGVMRLLETTATLPTACKAFNDTGLTRVLTKSLERGAKPPQNAKLTSLELFFTESMQTLSLLASNSADRKEQDRAKSIMLSNEVLSLFTCFSSMNEHDQMRFLTLLDVVSDNNPEAQEAIVNAGATPTLKKIPSSKPFSDVSQRILDRLQTDRKHSGKLLLMASLNQKLSKPKEKRKTRFKKKKKISSQEKQKATTTSKAISLTKEDAWKRMSQQSKKANDNLPPTSFEI